jgi:hypothetical protein
MGVKMKLRIPLLLLTACLLVIFGVHVHAQTSISAPPGNGWTLIASGLTAPTTTDATCVDGTTCYYAVAAVDQFGTAVDTTYVTAAIPATGTHTVTLTATASTTPGVTYSFFQGPPPLSPSALAAAVK